MHEEEKAEPVDYIYMIEHLLEAYRTIPPRVTIDAGDIVYMLEILLGALKQRGN